MKTMKFSYYSNLKLRVARLSFTFAIFCVFSSCIGMAVIHPFSYERDKFSIYPSSKGSYNSERENPTKDEVLRLWGEPDKIYLEDGIQVWKYNDGVNWIGICPIIGIPIPLILPIWQGKSEIYFDGNTAIKFYHNYTTWSGFCYCPENEGNMIYGWRFLKK